MRIGHEGAVEGREAARAAACEKQHGGIDAIPIAELGQIAHGSPKVLHSPINGPLGTASAGGGEPYTVVDRCHHIAQTRKMLTELRYGRLIAQPDEKAASESIDEQRALFERIARRHIEVEQQVLRAEDAIGVGLSEFDTAGNRHLVKHLVHIAGSGAVLPHGRSDGE